MDIKSGHQTHDLKAQHNLVLGLRKKTLIQMKVISTPQMIYMSMTDV